MVQVYTPAGLSVILLAVVLHPFMEPARYTLAPFVPVYLNVTLLPLTVGSPFKALFRTFSAPSIHLSTTPSASPASTAALTDKSPV